MLLSSSECATCNSFSFRFGLGGVTRKHSPVLASSSAPSGVMEYTIGFAQGRNRVPRDQTICSKPPGSPVESRAARFVLAKLHELEQLFVSDETGVQDLAKQRVVVLDVQADAVFDVTHCQPANGM